MNRRSFLRKLTGASAAVAMGLTGSTSKDPPWLHDLPPMAYLTPQQWRILLQDGEVFFSPNGEIIPTHRVEFCYPNPPPEIPRGPWTL